MEIDLKKLSNEQLLLMRNLSSVDTEFARRKQKDIEINSLMPPGFEKKIFSDEENDMFIEMEKNVEQSKKQNSNFFNFILKDDIFVNIDFTEIVATNSTDNSIIRGIVFGILFGWIGLVLGSLSGQHKEFTTFLIVYQNGERQTLRYPNGSYGYCKLIQKLR